MSPPAEVDVLGPPAVEHLAAIVFGRIAGTRVATAAEPAPSPMG